MSNFNCSPPKSSRLARKPNKGSQFLSFSSDEQRKPHIWGGYGYSSTFEFELNKNKGDWDNDYEFKVAQWSEIELGTIYGYVRKKFEKELESDFEAKEDLYVRAVRNLFKKSNYLSLYIQLLEGQITGDEFDLEISSRPDDFAIHVSDQDVNEELKVIRLIVEKINLELSVDDIESIFGITIENL